MFNTLPWIYWSNVTKISYLQRQIIVHSILYYKRNISVISDSYFDKLCYTLVGLQEAHTDAFINSEYYYAMNDFDGSTGHDIPDRLKKKDRDKVEMIANIVYNSWKRNGRNILV